MKSQPSTPEKEPNPPGDLLDALSATPAVRKAIVLASFKQLEAMAEQHDPSLPEALATETAEWESAATNRETAAEHERRVAEKVKAEAGKQLSEEQKKLVGSAKKEVNAAKKTLKPKTDQLRKQLVQLISRIEVTPENEAAFTAAFVGAWAFLEDAESLTLMLSYPAFTHSSRIRDARVNTGCIAQPDPAMIEWLLPEKTEDLDSRFGRFAYVMANGATDNTRAVAYMNPQVVWLSPIRTRTDQGHLEFTTIQSLVGKVACPLPDNVDHPYQDRIEKVIHHLRQPAPQNNQQVHRFDKISMSPDGQPYALSAPAYQPLLLRHALLSVCEKAAKAQEQTITEKAESNGKKPDIPGSTRLHGNLYAYEIANAQNGGRTLHELNGLTITPLVIPPPPTLAKGTGRYWKYASLLARTMQNSAKNQINEQELVLRSAEVLAGTVFHDACQAFRESLTKVVKRIQVEEKHGTTPLNAEHRERLFGEGVNLYEHYAGIVQWVCENQSENAPVARCLEREGNPETTVISPKECSDWLAQIGTLSLNAAQILETARTSLDSALPNDDWTKAHQSELVAAIEKGISRQALSWSAGATSNGNPFTGPHRSNSAAPSVRVRNNEDGENAVGSAIGLKIRVSVKDSTLDGGLTVGIPSLLAQHGFLYRNLTLKSDLEFNRSLMVIHGVTPHAPRAALHPTLPVFRNKQTGAWDSIGASDSFIARHMPFLQNQENPKGSPEPRQTTFRADLDLTFLVELPTQTLEIQKAQAVATTIAASRFSGGNVDSVEVEIVAQASTDSQSASHARGWTLPSGYLINPIIDDIDAIPGERKNLMERMFAHNLFAGKQRVSDLLPELKVPGVNGSFGFVLAGLTPLSDQEVACYRNGKPTTARWAEPFLVPVELKHSRHFSLTNDGTGGQEWPWREPEPKEHLQAPYYLM